MAPRSRGVAHQGEAVCQADGVTTRLRQALAVGGPALSGLALGKAVDAADVTAGQSSDMTYFGLVAGVGLGLALLAAISSEKKDDASGSR